jgi:glucose-1-phosphate cytidylyltransferase
MDTLKEKMMFDEMYAQGKMPWTVWESSAKIHQNQRLLNGGSSDSPSSEFLYRVK